jgi:hypothetical protein
MLRAEIISHTNPGQNDKQAGELSVTASDTSVLDVVSEAFVRMAYRYS